MEMVPRAGASGRAPLSISALSDAASFLMIRKRPSIESYVAPALLSVQVTNGVSKGD